MGTYLNPGIKSFQMSVNSGIYVDKSPMINYDRNLSNRHPDFKHHTCMIEEA